MDNWYKKKNNSTTYAREVLELRNSLKYRILQVCIYTARIRVLFDVEEWPGVGAGIRGVNVEYTYV